MEKKAKLWVVLSVVVSEYCEVEEARALARFLRFVYAKKFKVRHILFFELCRTLK